MSEWLLSFEAGLCFMALFSFIEIENYKIYFQEDRGTLGYIAVHHT